MSSKEWNEVLNLNLTSTFLLCKFSLKKMIKNKYGKIVNITSVVSENFSYLDYFYGRNRSPQNRVGTGSGVIVSPASAI